MVVVLALTAARLATWALFRVFLPTLLFALSAFFGRPLRRAAWRCREVGVEGERGLAHALSAVRGRLLGNEIDVEGVEIDERTEIDPPERAPTAKTRVSERPVRAPVAVDTGLEDHSSPVARRAPR